MKGKQTRQKRRAKMKHREKVTMKKGKNSRLMLPIIGIDSLDWLSMFFPCREARLTGFLTCLVNKMSIPLVLYEYPMSAM